MDRMHYFTREFAFFVALITGCTTFHFPRSAALACDKRTSFNLAACLEVYILLPPCLL